MIPRRWFPDRIDGDRIVLRRHMRENLPSFQRWYSDPEVARLTRYQDGPMRPDEIERFFAARALGPDSLAMAIHVMATGRLIGTCAFSQLDADNGSALFHITIGESEAWGRGYGTEATRADGRPRVRTLGLHRVALTVFAFNERAIRAYQQVGFSIEGRAREAICRDGRLVGRDLDEHARVRVARSACGHASRRLASARTTRGAPASPANAPRTSPS